MRNEEWGKWNGGSGMGEVECGTENICGVTAFRSAAERAVEVSVDALAAFPPILHAFQSINAVFATRNFRRIGLTFGNVTGYGKYPFHIETL